MSQRPNLQRIAVYINYVHVYRWACRLFPPEPPAERWSWHVSPMLLAVDLVKGDHPAWARRSERELSAVEVVVGGSEPWEGMEARLRRWRASGVVVHECATASAGERTGSGLNMTLACAAVHAVTSGSCDVVAIFGDDLRLRPLVDFLRRPDAPAGVETARWIGPDGRSSAAEEVAGVWTHRLGLRTFHRVREGGHAARAQKK